MLHFLSARFLPAVSDTYTTAQSYVFIQQDGERSIIMASGATSIITKHTVEEFFGKIFFNEIFVVVFDIKFQIS